mmetsp:Transcript_3288/g.6472  ORF Transcript_3288/g.6472 Transcript_3288/m.6472 type:complete len:358 (-) Transcript_3288:1754-2827(-)
MSDPREGLLAGGLGVARGTARALPAVASFAPLLASPQRGLRVPVLEVQQVWGVANLPGPRVFLQHGHDAFGVYHAAVPKLGKHRVHVRGGDAALVRRTHLTLPAHLIHGVSESKQRGGVDLHAHGAHEHVDVVADLVHLRREAQRVPSLHPLLQLPKHGVQRAQILRVRHRGLVDELHILRVRDPLRLHSLHAPAGVVHKVAQRSGARVHLGQLTAQLVPVFVRESAQVLNLGPQHLGDTLQQLMHVAYVLLEVSSAEVEVLAPLSGVPLHVTCQVNRHLAQITLHGVHGVATTADRGVCLLALSAAAGFAELQLGLQRVPRVLHLGGKGGQGVCQLFALIGNHRQMHCRLQQRLHG